ncbi:MAG: cell division protein FtsB [Gammaproteobacteria bacterium]|jgi:cell division protein FtsB|nr:cell division protein FtsB [Dehalococcoidia bacterium]HIG34753.1 cell division protein FtsB [Gammaproteobacteria bacterium]HIK97470.1 cell division protein FtsB [Gammaproteobacteria bacterium]|tara:strand:- start:1002 stop:1304 length:303 start_codon:yes stop_codon:yes gene_type:complete
MKFIALLLVLFLVMMQVNIWLTKDGYSRVAEIKELIQDQQKENNEMVSRNSQLKEEIKDLKDGYSAIEEKAREDIGMIKEGEEFYLLTKPRPDLEAKTDD